MDVLTLLLVGLVAGVLAALVVGGSGYGIIGDIVIGIVGAFVGDWLFRVLGLTNPLDGLPGTILVAFVGAILLLLILRLIRSAQYRRSGYAAPPYRRRGWSWWRR
jgi:uncharacterized membrane protein YeaQ/YmgE (transglycosylase-associated protein family)